MRIAAAVFFCLTTLGSTTQQTYPTRVAMDALMSMRFYQNNGQYLIEPMPVLFPPQGSAQAKVVIKKAGGGVAASADAEIVAMVGYPAFGVLQGKNGAPVFLESVAAGDYIMSVELGGKEISAYPYKVVVETGKDPFNPTTAILRTGPWSKAVFLINPIERPNDATNVGIWVNTRELPGYEPRKQLPISLHLMTGGAQVAMVDGFATDGDWTFFRMDLRHKTPQAATGPFTWASLTAKPGAYTLEYRSGAKVVRSYQFQVAAGKVNRIAPNELGHAGSDALPPQSIMTMSGSTQRVEQYWLAPVK